MTISIILLIVALVVFCLATYPRPSTIPRRINLIALGLALWMLSVLLTGHLPLH